VAGNASSLNALIAELRRDRGISHVLIPGATG
jgi:hypothetical protein